MYNLEDRQWHECAGIPRYEFLNTIPIDDIDEEEYIAKKMKEAQTEYKKLSVQEKAVIEEMVGNRMRIESILTETIESMRKEDLVEMMEEVIEDFKNTLPNDELLELFQSMTTEDTLPDEVIEEQLERFRRRKKELLNIEGEF